MYASEQQAVTRWYNNNHFFLKIMPLSGESGFTFFVLKIGALVTLANALLLFARSKSIKTDSSVRNKN